MNIQEAYKKLDLAKGLNQDRVETQYRKLKAEMEQKIATSQNEKLLQLYRNRLDEIEESYDVLIEHLSNDDSSSLIDEPRTQVKNKIQDVPSSPVKKNKNTLISVLVIAALVLAIPVVYFMSSETIVEQEEVDFFRKMEGETQVFVNNLILRQYPDSKSTKIETFPMGTRLIFGENESPKTDSDQRVWRKVRVIHPVYGWDRPDERFPYPYEGWMATAQCGVSWIEDSLTTANLARILGNEDAGIVTSKYRHGLVEFFQQGNYFDNWVIYGNDKKDKMQKVILGNLGNSEDDCKGDKQLDFVALLQNKNSGDQQLIVMSSDSYGNARVIYQEYQDPLTDYTTQGMRKLTSSELRSFNKRYNTYANNGILLTQEYDEKVLIITNGRVDIYYN